MHIGYCTRRKLSIQLSAASRFRPGIRRCLCGRKNFFVPCLRTGGGAAAERTRVSALGRDATSPPPFPAGQGLLWDQSFDAPVARVHDSIFSLVYLAVGRLLERRIQEPKSPRKMVGRFLACSPFTLGVFNHVAFDSKVGCDKPYVLYVSLSCQLIAAVGDWPG